MILFKELLVVFLNKWVSWLNGLKELSELFILLIRKLFYGYFKFN